MPCQPLRSWGWLWTPPIGAKNPQVVSRALSTHPTDFQESDWIESTQMSQPRVWSEMQVDTEPLFSDRFIRISKPWLKKKKKMVRTASPKVYMTLVSHSVLEDRKWIVWRALFIDSFICAYSTAQMQESPCAHECTGHLHANRLCLASLAKGKQFPVPLRQKSKCYTSSYASAEKMSIFFSLLLACTQSWPTLLRPFLLPVRLLCPWDFPGKNTGVGYHFLPQGIFLTQGSNPSLLCLLFVCIVCGFFTHWASYTG